MGYAPGFFYQAEGIYLQDIGSSVKVYGFVAIRDGEDYRRNYLFNRPQDNPVTINTVTTFLP
jgi:hypothetical protein